MKPRGLAIAFICIVGLVAIAKDGNAQPDARQVNPKVAFLRSLVMPGWGHYYVDHSNWRRGKYHLAAEAVLWISYAGLRIRSHNIEQNMFTYTRLHAGVDIEGRERNFQLAVSRFENEQAYNDYQERARNWDQLYPNDPQYQWQWDSESGRLEYVDMRDRLERTRNQLPALVSLMVINRVVSGVSAYIRARKHNTNLPEIGFRLPHTPEARGFVADIRFSF